MNDLKIKKRAFTNDLDLPLSTIKDMCNDGDINPQPAYQRDYVMDVKTASRLIESVFMKIPIPTVYLCEELDESFSVIDGQQRITSFVMYLENKFSLKGLEELHELNGKKFRDLDKSLQRILKSCTLHCVVLTKESQDLKYEIFARLNQGAIRLKPQELRNCIYRGTFNDMLEEVAKKNKHLKNLFLEDNKRKNYQEYILRFLCLRNYVDYSSSMNKTMNLYMMKHQNDSEEEIKKLRSLFEKTIDIVKQVFGTTAFCGLDRNKKVIANKFSGSVYDSIMIPCSMFDPHDLIAHADDIREQINDIKLHNATYQDYTYAATGSKNRLIGRIMLVYNIIAEIVGKPADGDVQRYFKKEDKQELWHDGYVCSWCGQKILSIEDAEVDHNLAWAKGGDTVLDNAQLLHRRCNREKSDSFEESTVNDIELINEIDETDEIEE